MRSPGRMLRPTWTRPLGLIPVLLLLGPAYAATSRTVTAVVERVADGETLLVLAENGRTLEIDLLGIDAPKIGPSTKWGQYFAEEARAYLDHLIGGQTVRVQTYGPIRETRLRAVIWNGPLNVNLLMVAMGYARVSRDAPCQAYCRDLRLAEVRAKRDQRGMWAQVKK
jgi:endonuclease YncB( thermonuclease family)